MILVLGKPYRWHGFGRELDDIARSSISGHRPVCVGLDGGSAGLDPEGAASAAAPFGGSCHGLGAGSQLSKRHAFVAFAFFGFVAWLGLRHATGAMRAVVATSFIIIVTAIGLSRIYLGVHWPSDVLASYLLSAAWLAALFLMIPLIEQTGLGPRLARSDRHPRIALAIGLVLDWLTVFFARYLSDPGSFTIIT